MNGSHSPQIYNWGLTTRYSLVSYSWLVKVFYFSSGNAISVFYIPVRECIKNLGSNKNGLIWRTYLEVRYMDYLSILVFCQYSENGWPATFQFVLVIDNFTQTGIYVWIWLQPTEPIKKKKKNKIKYNKLNPQLKALQVMTKIKN